VAELYKFVEIEYRSSV